jgi:hypothetical protein
MMMLLMVMMMVRLLMMRMMVRTMMIMRRRRRRMMRMMIKMMMTTAGEGAAREGGRTHHRQELEREPLDRSISRRPPRGRAGAARPPRRQGHNQVSRLLRCDGWWACYHGHEGLTRPLLESGADPTIASRDSITPVVVAKQDPDHDCVFAEGRRECVAALEVRLHLALSPSLITRSRDQPAEAWGMVAGGGAGLPAVKGPAGGRAAGERRCGGG